MQVTSKNNNEGHKINIMTQNIIVILFSVCLAFCLKPRLHGQILSEMKNLSDYINYSSSEFCVYTISLFHQI